MTEMRAKIRVRRGSYNDWAASNPVLLEGEVGYISSGRYAGKSKVGNGFDEWVKLPFAAARFPDDEVTLEQESSSAVLPLQGTILEFFQTIRNFLLWVVELFNPNEGGHNHNGQNSAKVSYNDLLDTDVIVGYVDKRISGVENLGHYVGAFDTYELLPKNTGGFPNGITVNDFATIRNDETRDGKQTRYVVSEIKEYEPDTEDTGDGEDTGEEPDTDDGDDEDTDTGDNIVTQNREIVWTYDITYSTDISGKTDIVEGAVNGNFAGLDASGNLTDSGKNANDFIQQIEKGVANGVATLGIDSKIPVSQLPDNVDLISTDDGNALAVGTDDKLFVAPSSIGGGSGGGSPLYHIVVELSLSGGAYHVSLDYFSMKNEFDLEEFFAWYRQYSCQNNEEDVAHNMLTVRFIWEGITFTGYLKHISAYCPEEHVMTFYSNEFGQEEVNFDDDPYAIRRAKVLKIGNVGSIGGGGSGSGKRYATFVIGNTGAGHTADMVDYLCTGTDDDVVINQAIQDLPVMGGKILILEGNYNINATIYINKNNISLEGIYASTILNATYTGNSLIRLTRELTNIKITNMVLNNIDNRFIAYGIHVDICNNIVISNNIININNPNNSSSAIYLFICYNVIVSNNLINNKGTPARSIFLEGSQSYPNQRNIISNNIINTSNTGRDNNYGIYINSNFCIISNNVLNNSSGNLGNGHIYGICIASNSSIVTNNIIKSTSANNGLCFGIMIGNNSNSNIITGNILSNNKSIGQSTINTFAFYFPNQGGVVDSSAYNQIIGNNVSGVTKVVPAGSFMTFDGISTSQIIGTNISVGNFIASGAIAASNICGMNNGQL
jgi:hypothetical protein